MRNMNYRLNLFAAEEVPCTSWNYTGEGLDRGLQYLSIGPSPIKNGSETAEI